MKTTFTLLFLIICTCMQAQSIHGTETTNLFEYGKPLISVESNFENLFRNWPKFISNGNDIDLLSYTKIGVIKNRKQAKKYVEKNFQPELISGYNTIGGQKSGANIEESHIYMNFEPSLNQQFSKSKMKEMINTVANEYINIGDEVYELKFVLRLKTYKFYVFVNPETKNVVTKGNIFGLDIPMDHIKYMENKLK